MFHFEDFLHFLRPLPQASDVQANYLHMVELIHANGFFPTIPCVQSIIHVLFPCVHDVRRLGFNMFPLISLAFTVSCFHGRDKVPSVPSCSGCVGSIHCQKNRGSPHSPTTDMHAILYIEGAITFILHLIFLPKRSPFNPGVSTW